MGLSGNVGAGGLSPSSLRDTWLGAAALYPSSGDKAAFSGTEQGLHGVSKGQWPQACPGGLVEDT